MSRAGDEAWSRWYAKRQALDAENFVVGAKVYRAARNVIEEGTVVRVSRCVIPRYDGPTREDPAGDRPFYVAQFGAHWEAQIYSWRFFATREEARVALAEDVRRQIEEKRREIAHLEGLLAECSAAVVAR